MKLSKDQKQKLVLGSMMLAGVVYAYFEFLLGPVRTGRQAAVKNSAALDPKIAEAKAQIAKTEALKAREEAAKLLQAQVKAMVPEGSPIAWFPPRITEFYKQRGVDRAIARMNSEAPEKDIPGYRKLHWGLEVARGEFVPFAAAVSEMENNFPLVEVQTFEAEAGREDVGTQRVAITMNILTLQ
jgi:hypothetical protein